MYNLQYEASKHTDSGEAGKLTKGPTGTPQVALKVL